MKLFDVVTVQDALQIMKENFNFNLETETIPLTESLNRYLANDIKSDTDVPHFRKSLVDGYAVLVRDVFLASDTNPVPMKIVGDSYMGQVYEGLLDNEEVVYVPTGGMVPNNAEGVVMIENCEKLNDQDLLVQKGVAIN